MNQIKEEFGTAQHGYRRLVTESPTCQGCGQSVDLDLDRAVVEAAERQQMESEDGMVWHLSCFNSFLDQGEEC